MKHEFTTPEYIAIVQQQVCERLQVTTEALSQQMYVAGVSFLYEYFKDAHIMATMMEHERIFWAWWRNEWHLRNEIFLDDDDVFEKTRWHQYLIYEEYNDPARLVTALRPPRVVTYPIYKSLKRAS